MIRGKRDVLVYSVAIAIGAVISVLHNPLTGAGALFMCISSYEFSHQIPRLVKNNKRR